MREKLETLPLTQLRELAKARNIKGTSTMKKGELIDLLVEEAEKMDREEAEKAAEKPSEKHSEKQAKGTPG